MECDASPAERTSVSGSSGPATPVQLSPPDDTDVIMPSLGTGKSPTPTPTGTLSRLGFKMPTSPTGAAPGSPIDRGQVSAITVVALLDKLVNMLEAVQDNQQRMEQRQADLEGVVQVVQGDVSRLCKAHSGTASSVAKLLERSRKVNVHIKEVKERMDRQGAQVKRLEANHSHLLRRNNFKVLIFQDENEVNSHVLVQDSLKTPQPSQYDAESTHPTPSIAESVDGSHYQGEGLQTISLSSEEEDDLALQREDEILIGEAMSCNAPHSKSRADKFKTSSLKKVHSIKNAFSIQSFEKRMNDFGSKIVPPASREKIKKSFTTNNPKSPTSRSSSFKVNPMTFNVKKVRDSDTPTPALGAPENLAPAHVEIPPLEGLDGELPLAEMAPQELALQEVKAALSAVAESVKAEVTKAEVTKAEVTKAEVTVNGEVSSVECEVNGERSAGLAVPEQVEDVAEDDDEEEEEQKEEKEEKGEKEAKEEKEENHQSPVEVAAEAQIPAAAITVEQVA
ncbi:caveolae-associated protein 2a [Genypterus blacodes]|uniref:caveolae-associated protein 2a n=1 Tax=Genypterus blacodes TaxID=154954 RepID=UPI003F7588F4